MTEQCSVPFHLLLPQKNKEFVGMGGEGHRGAAAEVGPAPLPCCSVKLASVARCGFGLFPFQQILKHIRMSVQELLTRKSLEKRLDKVLPVSAVGVYGCSLEWTVANTLLSQLQKGSKAAEVSALTPPLCTDNTML